VTSGVGTLQLGVQMAWEAAVVACRGGEGIASSRCLSTDSDVGGGGPT